MHTSKLTIRPYQIFILFAFLFSTCCALGYSGGTGEPSNPFRISSATDLLFLRDDFDNYDKCFILTSDINLDPNLPGNQVFTTAVIAYDTDSDAEFDGIPFTGVFDGNGHKITNLTINVNGVTINYIGLFGYIGENAQVKNLVLEQTIIEGNVTGGNYFGGLIGWNSGGSIDNCHSIVVISGSVAWGSLGGLVGYNYKGNIRNSYSVNVISGGSYFGGLIGYNNDGNVDNCYSVSTINSASNTVYPLDIGGLVGSNHGRINKCYSSGNINTSNSSVYYDGLGGLVGGNYGNISECYSISDVNGTGYAVTVLGGLVGYNAGDINNCYSTGNVYASGTYVGDLGGLVGATECGSIINSYSTGIVAFSGQVTCCIGGLVGYVNPVCGHIIGCYFLDTSGPDNGYGGSLTNSQMKQQNSFVGWDFLGETINGTEDIWWIIENVTYNKFNWQRILPPGSNDGDGGIYFPDYNTDNTVNFLDFSIFANAWLAENPFISLDDDNDVDIYDLKIFCDHWLQISY